MPKTPKKHMEAHFRQMSLRLVNESLPLLNETTKDELIFALATLLLDVASSDDITQGVMKDEC